MGGGCECLAPHRIVAPAALGPILMVVSDAAGPGEVVGVRCDGPCAALRSGAGLGHTLWGTPRLPTSALCEALPHEDCSLLLCPPGKGLLTGLFAPCPHQGGATAEGHSLWPRRSRVGGRDPGRFLHETVGSPAPGAMLWVVSDAPRPKRVVL